MIEYLKMAIIALITGVTLPLPVSSAAHFNFFSNIAGLSGDNRRFSFYYSFFVLVFSLVVLFTFRKTVIRGFKLAFSSEGEIKSRDNKYFVKNILFSILPSLVLFIPVSKGKLLMDYLDNFFNTNGLILAGIASVVTACVLIIAMWYTAKTRNPSRRAVDKKTVLRMSFYQLPCYVIPGFSHIATGAVNLFISDIGSRNLVGQLYIYLAPSMFFISIVKVIRDVLSGVVFDPAVLISGAVIFALASRLVISLTTKINLRRLFAFFCGYSIIFGIFITAISFFI